MVQMSELIKNFPAIQNGIQQSRLKEVRFYKITESLPRSPIVYDPGICIVLQGYKTGYLGSHKFHYDANHYLVTTVTMPFEVEVIASPKAPLLGLFIDIDMGQLHDLIGRMGLQAEMSRNSKNTLPLGIGPAAMDQEMTDATSRLLKALQSDTQSQILGPGILREILFHSLRGSQAPVLYSLAMYSGTFSKIAQVLNIMKTDYAVKLDIDQLANTTHMSTSAFHRAFKEITSESPMQYLKKIRLTKARDLMIMQQMKANSAAYEVGYESPSQFSREFKRYFGQTPAEILREQRTAHL